MSTVAFTKASFKTFVEGIFVGKPEDTEGHLKQLLDSAFEHKDDGERRNRDEFIQHVKDIRNAAIEWSIRRVVWLVQDGRRLSGRYYVMITLPDSIEPGGMEFNMCEQTQDIVVAETGKILGITEITRRIRDGEEMWEPAENA